MTHATVLFHAINMEAYIFFTLTQQPLVGQDAHYRGFTATLRHSTLGRTPLDE